MTLYNRKNPDIKLVDPLRMDNDVELVSGAGLPMKASKPADIVPDHPLDLEGVNTTNEALVAENERLRALLAEKGEKLEESKETLTPGTLPSRVSPANSVEQPAETDEVNSVPAGPMILEKTGKADVELVQPKDEVTEEPAKGVEPKATKKGK